MGQPGTYLGAAGRARLVRLDATAVIRLRPYVYDLNDAEPRLRSLEWSTRRYEISVEIRPGSAYLHVTDVQRMRGYGLPLRWPRHARDAGLDRNTTSN